MKSKRRLLSLILVFSMIAGLYPNSYVYAYSDTESLEVSSEETADEATTAYPAFHPEPVIMDGVEIKVSADEGVFPESAVLSVNKPKASEEKKIENIIEEERSGTENVAASYTYDIKVLDADGNELQPEDGQKVEVSFSMAEVSNTNLDTNVYHISEDKSGELSADTLHVSENDDTVTAETDGFSYYTVEFTYDEKQYVMEGDTSVALTDILSYVGITKADGNVATDSDVTAVSVSDESLFSASNESGVWIVTAHQAFHTDEWMKVTVDGVEYEIKITDSMQITITIESVTTTSDKGKTFMCFSLAPSYNELNNYNGGDGRPNWGLPRYSTSGDITITVDSMPDNLYFYVEYSDGGGGGTTGPIGSLSNGVSNTLTATYSQNFGIGGNITVATATIKYHVNKASDPSVTAPTLASGLTYTGSAKQLISSAGSTSGNNMQYGISSSNTTQPTSWYGSISDNNMKKTDVGTYYVWYKCDAVSNYNAVAATCVGSVSIAKASNPITYGPQSWSYKYATTAQTKTLNAATSAQGTVTYSLQSQKKGNNTVNYFTFNTSTRVLTAAKNTPTGTYTVVVRASAAGGSNYNSGTADSTITVTVNKAAGSISYGTPAVTKTYGDSAFTNALTKAGDGTVSYSSSNTSVASINSNGQVTIVGAGTATITATVADGTNYSYASKTAAYSLTVNRKAITIKANDQTITYGGTISTGTDKVTVNTLVSGNTLSTITLTPSTSGATTNGTITPGNAAIIKNNTDVTNNYEISYQNGKLVIDKANISPAVNITGWTYGEYSPEINSPSVTGNTGNGAVTYEYKVKDAADNTYTASVPTDAGNYTVRATIAETSNYNGRTATKDFTISNAAMSVTANGYNDTYDGQAHGITAVAPEGATIKYRTSDSGAYNLTDNPQYTDAGTYTVYYQITKPNYTTVTGSETVVINKKQLELSWDDSTRAFTYDGSSHKPSAGISGVLENDDCGVTVSGEQTNYSESPYTATASLTGEQKDNYVLPTEHTTTFTIAKREVTVTAKSQTVKLKDDISRTVNDAELSGAVEGHTLSEIAFEAVDTTSTTTVGNERDILPKDAVIKNGNMDVTGNYDITFVKGLLTVEKKVPTYTPPVANTLTYNGDAQVLIQAGDSEDDTVMWYRLENGEWTSDYSAITATHADTYTVYYKVVGNSNFEDVFSDDEPESLIVTIDKKDITISGIEVNTKTYDGNTTTTLDYSHVTYGGIEAGDSLTVTATGTFENANAGVDKNVAISGIVLGGDSINDYELAVAGQQEAATANIEPKEVGLEWHIGDVVYDGVENIPTFTFNGKVQKPSAIATELIEGDNCNVTVSGEKTNAGNNYTAEASALDNANYKLPEANTISFIIIPRTITKNDITFGHSTDLAAGKYEYTGDVIKPEITVSTVLAGDADATDLVLDTDYTMNRDTTAISTGTHYIKFDGKGNYDGTVYLPWYIVAKTVTVTAEAKSKVYGDDDPEFTVAVSGAPADEISYNYIGRDTAENDSDKENVGNHAIVVTGDATQGDYNVEFVGGTLTITQAPVTVKANNMSKTYGDDDPEELTTTITGLKRNDDRSVIDYDIVRAEGENAGSYTITPTGVANQGNYNVTYSTGTFKINKRKLSADFVGLDKVSFQASGDNHSPNVVFSKYTPVTLNTDYRVSGETTANDAGVHEITVTGIGTNFTGSVVLPWYITGVGDKEVTYDGQPHTIVVGDGETNITFKQEKTDADYTLTTPPEYTNAGSYTIYYKTTVANPMYGYIEGERQTLDVEGTAVLTINRAPLTVTAEDKTKVYGDADPEFTYTVSGIISGETVNDAVTGALTRILEENVGTYEITQGTLTGTANYEIAAYTPATFTITLKPLSLACFDVKLGSDMLNKNTVVYNAGQWAVTATAAAGIEGLGTITPRYFKVDGETETETTPAGTAPTDAGKYRVRLEVSEGTNYSGTGSDAAGLITTDDWWFEIVKAPFPAETDNANWPTANTGLEYSGSAQALLIAPTTTLSGYTMNYRIDDGVWGTAIPTGKDAAEYTVYAKYVSTDPANRLDSEERSYTVSIEPKPLTVTADDKSKTYGENDPELTYTIPEGGLVSGDTLTGSLSREEGEDVREGGYAINAGTLTNDNNPNYDITFVPGTFTITRAAITPSVSIEDWIYGDTASVPVVNGNTGNGEVTYTYAVRNSAEYTEAVPTDAGEYTIKASIAANGNCEAGEATADFVITKKQVEVAAENKEKEYGSEDPALTYTVTSKNGSDANEVLSNHVLSDISIARTAGENVNELGYAITVSQSDGANSNYDISFVPGTFSITRKSVTVTADNASKVYGAEEPASFTATVEGLVGNDSIDYSVTRAIGEDVGEYAITPAGDVTQGNYTVSYAAGTFTITKATLAVTAEAKSKTYGETDPDLTYAVDGFVNGDTAETVMSGGLSRASGENVGTYAIEQNTLSAGDNYTISYTGADFTIGKKTLTVTADVKSKTYGNADPSLTYNADGFENDDTAETVMTGALTRVAGEDVRDGGYAILQGTLTAGNNYNISYTGADLTITKRNVTLTSASDTKAYNGTVLTNDDITVGGDGFADNEGAEYDVTGTQTLPGESDNTFTYSLKDGTKADNYEITKSVGTLTVTGRTADGTDKKYEITMEANSGEVTYDGTEHMIDGFVTDEFTVNDVTYKVSGLSASTSGTDAGEYTAVVTGTAVVKDSAGNDLTDQFIVNTTDGTLTIDKRNVTLTSATASKAYDGMVLTDDTVKVSGGTGISGGTNASDGGFTAGEGAAFNVTGSQKVVGSSANSFTYTLNEGTKADNYNITKVEGTLTVTSREVKYEISPQAESGTVMYDGEEHAVSGFVTDTFEVDGNTYKVSGLTAEGSGTDAGEYTVNVSGTAVVKDSDGADVSGEFSVIPKTGKLIIEKRSVTLTSSTDSKEYDGDALRNDTVTVSGDGFADGEGAIYNVTGTRTVVGVSENSFGYTLDEHTKADNYDITTSFGMLTVNNRNTKYEVTLNANSKTVKYDGTEKSVTGYMIDGEEGSTFTASNGKTYRISGMTAEASGTDAGTYTVNVTGTPTIKDSADQDVTVQFAVSVESGILTVTRRNVTLTSDTASKAYDGKPLTSGKVSVSGDGFAEGESAEYTFTGSQTLPGESDNTFTYELTGAKPDNYNITTAYGKLTVNERNGEGDDGKYKITVKANSGTFIYDGKAHTVTGFETLEYTINDVTYTVSGISASGSLTDAGETTVEITGTPKVADAEGNDLTGSFDVICEDGKLTVKKCSQEKPDGLSSRKTSSNTAKDGVITGLDENKLYEYSEDDGINWSKVDEGSAEVTGIGAGDVLVRFQEDGNRLPSEVADVIVGIKENQAAPLREDFVITNASEENASDGKISGVDDTMEYSLDDGKNWTPVEENQTLIDNLPVGDTELRYKGDEDKNPGEALKIPIGVTSRTQGVVNFNHNNTSETEISVTTVVEAAASSNIEDFAATQMKEGKDVKVELEIIPQKEEEVSEESVAKIGDTVKEVFAGIETESIVTEYLQIDLAKYVDNAKEGNISDTKTPLEIELKYDKSKTGNPVIIRTHNGAVKAFEKLMTRPAGGFRDGTYHVADGKIYLYSQYFSDFAIVYATEKTYYVNIDLGNGESIQKIVGENDGIELPANLTREGYSFGGLYKDASYKDAWNYDTDKVNEDITLYGKWNRSVSGVSVTPSEMKLKKAGETLQIKVTVTPADAANTKVTYKSSDAKVATVDANGKITAVANGTATITVTTEDGAKTATVKVTVAIPNVSKQGTSEQPLQEPAKEEKAEISMNAGLKISQTGSKINIKWGKVKEADGYDVYVTYCGMGFNKKKPNKTLKKNSLVSTTITKINGKKINLKKNYKIYVVAYRMVEGKKVKLARTITGHIVGRLNTKYSNVRKITLSKSKYTIKVGKTAKVKAKTVLVDKSKKQLSNAHAAEFRYASSNKNIATVDKNGKIKGVAQGTCTIYVYARNGYAKKVKVTVK